MLAEQAAELVGSGEPPILHPAAQRRLIRILRDIDMNALDKLLLWESLFKEKHALGFEAFGGRPGKKSDAADQSRLRRLKRQIQKALRLLDERGVGFLECKYTTFSEHFMPKTLCFLSPVWWCVSYTMCVFRPIAVCRD